MIFFFEERLSYRIQPSLYVTNGKKQLLITDTSWQQVILDYTATGSEFFLTIGNFSQRDITGNTSIPTESHFWFFLDKVSLVPLTPEEGLCPDWQQKRAEIYDQNERHQYLERYIKFYRNKPPVPKLSITTIQSIDTLIIPNIQFSSGRADLTKSSFSLLDSFCNRLQGKNIDSLVITGNTDSTGTELLNKDLSLNRAHAVANYISSRIDIKPDRLLSKGLAALNPIADNKTLGGRQLNRRVEIFIYIRQ